MLIFYITMTFCWVFHNHLRRSLFFQHILRAHFQTAIWITSTIPFPVVGEPTEHGWKFDIADSTSLLWQKIKQLLQQFLSWQRKCGCKRGCESNGCSCRQKIALHGIVRMFCSRMLWFFFLQLALLLISTISFSILSGFDL
jgi:hypothetical protein